MAKFLKRHRPTQDWSMTGSFMNKPLRGWLHPDEQLAADAGVCYGVRVSNAARFVRVKPSVDIYYVDC